MAIYLPFGAFLLVAIIGPNLAIPKLKQQLDKVETTAGLCPLEQPRSTNGKWTVNKTIPETLAELRHKLPMVDAWGHWQGPKECRPRQRIAIVIPYRDRFDHLRGLLNNLHPFLQRQQLEYQIFVANQAFPSNGMPDKFNRGKLINAAFVEINRHFCGPNANGKKEEEGNCWDCYIFHDVDLVPEDDRNFYKCRPEPARLLSGTEEGQSNEYMGGVTAMGAKQFEKVNGFSNKFWGWGAEDLNLRIRFDLANQSLTFVKSPIGNFTTLELVKKPKDATNPSIRSECQKSLNANVEKTWREDGLVDLHYKLLNITDEVLYTNITVDLLMSLKGHPCGEEMFDWKSWHRK